MTRSLLGIIGSDFLRYPGITRAVLRLCTFNNHKLFTFLMPYVRRVPFRRLQETLSTCLTPRLLFPLPNLSVI